jgi:hypothetical protein
LRQIDNFISYGNIVDVSTMYPGYKNYYCAFRTYGNSWKLAVVGSKCLEEMLAVGSESNESFCPLILVKKDGKFRVLNSL